MSAEEGVTWGELKAWVEQNGGQDDDIIGHLNTWYPLALGKLVFERDELPPGCWGIHITDD